MSLVQGKLFIWQDADSILTEQGNTLVILAEWIKILAGQRHDIHRTRQLWQNKAAFTEKGYTMAANILAWSHQKKSY